MIVRSLAPLRLGFAGGGTDLIAYSSKYGGAVLNATINMYAHCTLIDRNDNKVEFFAQDLNKKTILPINKIEVAKKILPLHYGVYKRLVHDFNIELKSLTIITTCDAPIGSGLGSSSAIVVAMIQAFVERFNLPLSNYDIANYAYDIERNDLKLSGGKQDQFAATFGGFNSMDFLKDGNVIVKPIRTKDWFVKELYESMVLCFLGKSRESADIINKQIKSAKSKKLESFHKIKQSVYDMEKAISLCDVGGVVKAINKAWEAKKNTADCISNTKINTIYTDAMKNGAIGGKISGAGGGGFFVFFCHPEDKLHLTNFLKKQGCEIFNFQFTYDGTVGWRIYGYDGNKKTIR